MITTVSPQPQRWQGHWLWLNTLYTTSELCHNLDWQWHEGHMGWCWRVNATPKPKRKKATKQC